MGMQRLYSKYRIIPFNEYIIEDDEDKSNSICLETQITKRTLRLLWEVY